VDFKAATDVLTRGPSVTLAKIAERFALQLATVARARIETVNRRPPPPHWETVIADMAEEHAAELESYVTTLRQLATRLRKP
jgi:hypothetical protein